MCWNLLRLLFSFRFEQFLWVRFLVLNRVSNRFMSSIYSSSSRLASGDAACMMNITHLTVANFIRFKICSTQSLPYFRLLIDCLILTPVMKVLSIMEFFIFQFLCTFNNQITLVQIWTKLNPNIIILCYVHIMCPKNWNIFQIGN